MSEDERLWVAEKMNKLRAEKGEEHVEVALQAAADSLKVETIEVDKAPFLRCFGSVGIDGQVVEIDEMARIGNHKKKDLEGQLRARGARLIVFLEEGIVQPPVTA